MTFGLLLLAAFTMAYSMIANKLASTILTAPMLFIGFGYLLSIFGILETHEMEEVLHLVAEVALIILLFLDAAQTDLNALRKKFIVPARMLLLGLPLSILIGAAVVWAFLPSWPFVAVALVAAILAPTDAALGQAVVTNKAVPEETRRSLTVESGLNDGMALPIILLFASLTANVVGAEDRNWFLFAGMQLILGPMAGIVIGAMGAKVLLWAKERNYTADIYEGVGALAMAIAAYLGADLIGGNGFISAFVAGLLFGQVVQGKCMFIYEFTESEGQGLTWGAFFLLGLVLVPEAIHHLTPTVLAIILLSFFVVRPLAIWLSLIGTDTQNVTRLFYGWFGPRGLATALFALIVVNEIDASYGEEILNLAVNAVWISALLHGITANPGAKWYASKINTPEQPQH